jgi:hypothetical protein
LEQLSTLACEKVTAVRNDDLMALDSILRQEQALSLSMRGMEQRRVELLEALNLQTVPLSRLPNSYPKDMQLGARKEVEALQNQYRVYQSYAEVARNTLETNIRDIEKALSKMDPGNHEPDSTGYATYAGYAQYDEDVEPPASMRTDFLA